MSETIDPITWLKDFVSSRRRVELDPNTNELWFENSSIRLPMHATTAWKRKDGKGYYALGSLWLQMKMKDLKFGEYMKESQRLNIAGVTIGDKREIIEFFTGALDESTQIDTAIRPQTLIKKSDIRSGRVIAAQEHQLRKRDSKRERKNSEREDHILGEDEKDLQLADYITMNEKAIHGRATVLQCRKKNFLKVLMLGYQMVRQTQ